MTGGGRHPLAAGVFRRCGSSSHGTSAGACASCVGVATTAGVRVATTAGVRVASTAGVRVLGPEHRDSITADGGGVDPAEAVNRASAAARKLSLMAAASHALLHAQAELVNAGERCARTTRISQLWGGIVRTTADSPRANVAGRALCPYDAAKCVWVGIVRTTVYCNSAREPCRSPSCHREWKLLQCVRKLRRRSEQAGRCVAEELIHCPARPPASWTAIVGSTRPDLRLGEWRCNTLTAV
eukprot:scaffold119032_cov69-Phaeocystis_antarctica.AAC.2